MGVLRREFLGGFGSDQGFPFSESFLFGFQSAKFPMPGVPATMGLGVISDSGVIRWVVRLRRKNDFTVSQIEFIGLKSVFRVSHKEAGAATKGALHGNPPLYAMDIRHEASE
jgi:hypothetical protein